MSDFSSLENPAVYSIGKRLVSIFVNSLALTGSIVIIVSPSIRAPITVSVERITLLLSKSLMSIITPNMESNVSASILYLGSVALGYARRYSTYTA